MWTNLTIGGWHSIIEEQGVPYYTDNASLFLVNWSIFIGLVLDFEFGFHCHLYSSRTQIRQRNEKKKQLRPSMNKWNFRLSSVKAHTHTDMYTHIWRKNGNHWCPWIRGRKREDILCQFFFLSLFSISIRLLEINVTSPVIRYYRTLTYTFRYSNVGINHLVSHFSHFCPIRRHYTIYGVSLSMYMHGIEPWLEKCE